MFFWLRTIGRDKVVAGCLERVINLALCHYPANAFVQTLENFDHFLGKLPNLLLLSLAFYWGFKLLIFRTHLDGKMMNVASFLFGF